MLTKSIASANMVYLIAQIEDTMTPLPWIATTKPDPHIEYMLYHIIGSAPKEELVSLITAINRIGQPDDSIDWSAEFGQVLRTLFQAAAVGRGQSSGGEAAAISAQDSAIAALRTIATQYNLCEKSHAHLLMADSGKPGRCR